MKSIRIIAVIVSALFILSFTANADAQNKKNDKKSSEITFVVSGMDCANCKKKMDAVSMVIQRLRTLWYGQVISIK